MQESIDMSEIAQLTRRNVCHNVGRRTKGSYQLGFLDPVGSFLPMYPGRSDTDSRRRLLDHVRAGIYTHFRFFPTRTVREAFTRECRDYHLLLEMGIDNVIHPRRPRNLSYECPYCKGGASL